MNYFPKIESPETGFMEPSGIFKNMKLTEYFKSLESYPIDNEDMIYFARLHNGIQFLDGEKIHEFCVFFDAIPLQLDSFFILLQTVKHTFDMMHKKLVVKSYHLFRCFFDIPNTLAVLFDHKFFTVFTYVLMGSLNHQIESTDFFQLGNSALVATTATLFETYFPNTNISIEDVFDFFKKYSYIMQKYFSYLWLHFSEINRKISTFDNILNLCSKDVIYPLDKCSLKLFITINCYAIKSELKHNILNEYYRYAHKKFEINIKKSSRKQSINNIISIINKQLSPIGYEVVDLDYDSLIHSLLDCLVEYGFASDSKEIMILICQILNEEKNISGYLNKTDNLTLCEHLEMYNLANDTSILYDDLVKKMEDSSDMFYDYPFEIILNIISKHYNVNIKIYHSNGIDVFEFKNACKTNPKNIVLFQYSVDSYYNIIPIRSKFIKTFQNEPDYSEIVNDLNDIVEV